MGAQIQGFLHLHKFDEGVRFNSQGGMWLVLQKLGVPEKTIKLIQSFHQDMSPRIRIEGSCLEGISVHIFRYFDTDQPCTQKTRCCLKNKWMLITLSKVGMWRQYSSVSLGQGRLPEPRMSPRQRSPDDSQVAWIASKEHGEIVRAHYTLMGG